MDWGRGRALKVQDMKMQNMKLLHILVVLLCYITDSMFNSLISTNYFDELFFAFDCNVVNTTDRILNALYNCFDELFVCK